MTFIRAMEDELLAFLAVHLPGWQVVGSLQPGAIASREGIRHLPEVRLLLDGMNREGMLLWSLEVSTSPGSDGLTGALAEIIHAMEQDPPWWVAVESVRRRDNDPKARGFVLTLTTQAPADALHKASIHGNAVPVIELDETVALDETDISFYTLLNELEPGDSLVFKGESGTWALGPHEVVEGVIQLERPLKMELPQGSVIYALRDGMEIGDGVQEERLAHPGDWSVLHRDLADQPHRVSLGRWREKVRWHLAPCSAPRQEEIREYLYNRDSRAALLLVLTGGEVLGASLENLEMKRRGGIGLEWNAGRLDDLTPFVEEET